VGGPGSGSLLRMLELRQLGGALAEAPEGAGALGALSAEYALFAVGLPMTEGMAEAIGAYTRLREIEARYDGGDLFRSNHPVESALHSAAT
jgi:hypothetical protein